MRWRFRRGLGAVGIWIGFSVAVGDLSPRCWCGASIALTQRGYMPAAPEHARADL